MKDEKAVMLRSKILEATIQIPGPQLEKFLAGVLSGNQDAGVRSEAAAALGKVGSEKQFGALAEAELSDRTTGILIGDVGGQSSARRAATFAVAAQAARFPKLADDAAAKLRELPVREDPGKKVKQFSEGYKAD